jgi:putative lipoprotein
MSGQRRVTGVVMAPLDVAPGATIHVRVEDVSRADAASVLIAEQVTVLSHTMFAGQGIPFECAVPDVDPRARYSVRVHVDRDGSGVIKQGDLISTQSYPALTHGAPDRVEVAVVQV